MSRRRRNFWPWILLLLGTGGGSYWWWSREQDKKPAAAEYETAAVSKGDLKKMVKASGVVNPLAKVEIGSQISGTIIKLNVDFNSLVKAGEVLCQLDPATYDAAYAQSAAERSSAEADRDYQKRTIERKRQLLEQKLFPQADFDKAEADFKGAEAKLLLADARLKKAKVDLERCTIYAPIDGVIIDRTAEIGMTIAASFNAPKLFILANDLTKMQINAQVSEAEIGQVQQKQKVKFKVDAYVDPFEGEVVQVRNSPITEENVVNYDAIIAVNNPDLKLKPGMTGVAEIVTSERFGVVKIPNGALRFKPAKPRDMSGDSALPGPPFPKKPDPDRPVDLTVKQVYLPPSKPTDEPVSITVKIGINDGKSTEILEGLREGDTVITLLKPPAGSGGMNNPFGGGMGRR